jgi:hypothetical protein
MLLPPAKLGFGTLGSRFASRTIDAERDPAPPTKWPRRRTLIAERTVPGMTFE